MADYGYVPFASRSLYDRTPALTIANLMRQSANDQANTLLRGGEIQGQMVANLGNVVAKTLGDYLQYKEKAPILEAEKKLRELQTLKAQGDVDAQRRTLADQTAVDTAMGSGFDLDTITRTLQTTGHGHLVPQVTKSWNEAEAAKVNLQQARTKAQEAEADYFGSLAAGVKPYLTGPDMGIGAAQMALQHAKEAGFNVDPLVARIQQNPMALPALVDELIQKSPTQRKMLGEEADRALKQAQEERARQTAAEAAANTRRDDARADATLAETKRHNEAMERRPVAGAATSQALTEDGVEYAATQYRLTGKMPSLGNGAGDVKAKIISQAAAQSKALGQSPAASIQRQAAFQADSKALAKMRTMSSSAEAFENKALQQAEIVRELSTKVPRTQWPLVNQAIIAGKIDLLGDKNAQLLANAITTYTAEYAKIIEGSTGSAGGSSDAARRAAERLLNPTYNKGTIAGSLDLMNREMRLTVQGYDSVIDHITDRMSGVPSATPKTGGAPTEGTEGVVNGVPAVWKTVNGKAGWYAK